MGTLGFLANGCGRPVFYGLSAQRDAALISPEPISLYFDRQGSLYPAVQDGLVVNNSVLEGTGGFLLDYYTHNVAPGSAREGTWKQLLNAYALPMTPINSDNSRYSAWRALQQQMRQRFIKQLNAHLLANKPDALVVLVHGYNNDVSAASWYAGIERSIRRRSPNQRIQFLEVRWDGGTSATALGIWGYAQESMYPVGLALRQVLAGIASSDLPVRIMAHSTGCPLTSIALWNSTAALSGNGVSFWGEDYQAVCQQPAFATPQLRHLRVALLAPAMPSTHFNNFYDRTPADADSSGHCERIVFGYNTHDQATGKWILPASWAGDTRLGVHPEDYGPHVVSRVHSRAATRVYQVDFTAGMKRAGTRGAHSVADLMQDYPAFDLLLDTWLTDAVPGKNAVGLRAGPKP